MPSLCEPRERGGSDVRTNRVTPCRGEPCGGASASTRASRGASSPCVMRGRALRYHRASRGEPCGASDASRVLPCGAIPSLMPSREGGDVQTSRGVSGAWSLLGVGVSVVQPYGYLVSAPKGSVRKWRSKRSIPGFSNLPYPHSALLRRSVWEYLCSFRVKQSIARRK